MNVSFGDGFNFFVNNLLINNPVRNNTRTYGVECSLFTYDNNMYFFVLDNSNSWGAIILFILGDRISTLQCAICKFSGCELLLVR